MPTDLYDRWQRTVAIDPDAVALTEASSGARFTFAELETAASKTSLNQFPNGNTATFIAEIISAWRDGVPACPLEPNSPPPDLSQLPTGIAHIKTTSGSTGTPRLILFSVAQLAADAENIVATMGLTSAEPNIGVISMAHSYGFSNLVLPLLLHGIPLILCADPLPGSFQRALTFLPNGGGAVPAVPAMWRAWLKSGCLDSQKIRTAISAGAPLSTVLETAIYEQTGIKVHNFYGSSECGGIAYDRSSTPRANPDAVGSPLSGVETLVAENGCLIVRSQAAGTTYWPDADSKTLADSQFITSDLADIAPDGTITLGGRAGDLINIAGRKLDPSTVESELQKHPTVDHCLVFGIPSQDPERVQEIVAITNRGDEKELRAHLAKSLPAWQKVRHWWITDGLKPNARGKFSRSEWRDKWTSRLAPPTA